MSFALGILAGRVLNAEGASSHIVFAAKQNNDMAGIEKLHQLDQRVTLLNDPKALQEEWTNDAVRLEPDGPADVGKAAIYAADVRFMNEGPGSAIVSYKPDIRDVQVSGDWAFEWGYFAAGCRSETGDSDSGQTAARTASREQWRLEVCQGDGDLQCAER